MQYKTYAIIKHHINQCWWKQFMFWCLNQIQVLIKKDAWSWNNISLFKRLCSFIYIYILHVHIFTQQIFWGPWSGERVKVIVLIWLSKRAVFPSQAEYSPRGLVLFIKNWLDREQWALDIRKEPAVDVSLSRSSATANSSLHTDRCLLHPSPLGCISKTANHSQQEPI